MISNKASSNGKNYKCFTGYKDDDYKVKPLCIMFPKTSRYIKSYDDETKWMSFLTEDDEWLEKYNKIWNNVSIIIKNRI